MTQTRQEEAGIQWEEKVEMDTHSPTTDCSSNTHSTTTISLISILNHKDIEASDVSSNRSSPSLDHDEGSPASQASLSSEDFLGHSPSKDLIILPEGFQEMVEKQQATLRAQSLSNRTQWVAARQSEQYKLVPAELRLPSLICEAFHHEKKWLIEKSQGYLNEDSSAALLADTRRSYIGIFAEVKRALKSVPPTPPAGQEPVSVEQHRHNIASSGVQCFAAMLPYSNGLCGAVTDCRRAHASATRNIPSYILMDSEFHDLHVNSTQSASTKAPRGTSVGHCGRFIPVSMSAEHGKGDKISAVRRKVLASKRAQSKANSPTQSNGSSNYRLTPMFARQRMPNGRSIGICGSNAAPHHQVRCCMQASPTQDSHRHVDPVPSH